MKTIKLSLLLAVATFNSNAQLIVYSPTVLPVYPTTSDSVNILTRVLISTVGSGISKNFSVDHQQKTIWLERCYSISPFTFMADIRDTFSLGLLNYGTYTGTFQANMYTGTCSPYSSKTFTIQIGAPTDISKLKILEQPETIFYPNPVLNYVYFSDSGFDKVEINNSAGETLKIISNPFPGKEMDLSELAPGMYFIRMERKNTYKIHKIIKE